MNDYSPIMVIRDRVRGLREQHGLTQEDLAAKSGVSLATIQRVEYGASVSANTIASLAAAFDLPANELTSPASPSNEPYLPLTPMKNGRSLIGMLRVSQRLDFDFAELRDLRQAELVEELQGWCEARIGGGVPEAAVARVKLELEATDLLKRMAETHLTVSGETLKIDIYEVDEEFGYSPIILAQWDQVCAVIRIGCNNTSIDRGYVMDRLGKWENPAGNELVYPADPEVGEPTF